MNKAVYGAAGSEKAAKMRVTIKRILRCHAYPPDKQADATELVLEQAEVLCKDWTEHI